MALSREDLAIIKSELDERYVMQSTCDDIQRETAKKLANDDKRIDRLMDRVNVWNKLLWAIASASISSLIVAIFQLILKQ